ncbi:hypothetical protein HO133_004666 [Letharia lupina]|uniref:Uncharacterized protein n=1 Tax=Letharia lupina TaxID=560253 RepID=A0A8H6KZW0_9LECA|nr:uncharacterized protein HO133_004666 [Letharia lupina]KAF6230326.1 hypothetical protein HO133_004666 [Letharia lupina]
MDAKADVCRRSYGSKRIAGSGGMATRSQLAAHAIKDKAQSSMMAGAKYPVERTATLFGRSGVPCASYPLSSAAGPTSIRKGTANFQWKNETTNVGVRKAKAKGSGVHGPIESLVLRMENLLNLLNQGLPQTYQKSTSTSASLKVKL